MGGPFLLPFVNLVRSFVWSRVDIKWACPILSSIFLIWGMGNTSKVDTAFRFLNSIHSLILCCGFGMITMGLLHELQDSSMIPVLCVCSNSTQAGSYKCQGKRLQCSWTTQPGEVLWSYVPPLVFSLVPLWIHPQFPGPVIGVGPIGVWKAVPLYSISYPFP